MIISDMENRMIREGPVEKDRVLVMDDEEMLCELFSEILIRLGYDAEFVNDGRKAIEIFSKAKQRGDPFGKVILDLNVPGGMGGRETVRELLKIDPQVKAIVSSGFPHDPVMVHYEDYGFQAALLKPYNLTELEDTLNRLS